LPAEKDVQRFAVCWNGLVYPVISIGEIADVRADAEAMNDAERQRREQVKEVHRERENGIHFRQIKEQHAVDHTFWRAPIKVCYLLRLGEVRLAEESWRLWNEGVKREVNSQSVHMDDPYFLFAQHWIWALFDRGVCAHVHGDHGLSLASCEMLADVTEAARATVKERGFTKGFSGEISNLPFAFLEPLPALLKEQRRRVKEEPYQTAIEKGLESFDSKEELIAALIRDLENVSARQWRQPGGISLQDDPIVAALIEQGSDAVEPLIDCIASDMRLTRSVSFHRDFFYHREPKGVDEAAHAAIGAILETRTIPRPYSVLIAPDKVMEHKKEVADEIREYWDKVKDTPLTQRWYDALADDEATDKWLEAANLITRPTSFKTKDSTMRGEPLRDISDPSVTELMAKRVRQLTLKDKAPSSREMFRMHKACNLALMLATWDLEGSLPTLREQMADCLKTFESGWESGSWTTQILGSYIAKLTLKRVEAGDEAALDEYAAWVRDVTPQQLEGYASEAFEPLGTHAAHPAIADVSDSIFNGEASPWNPIMTDENLGKYVSKLDFLRTPMIKNAAFRQQILRGLNNTTVVGYVTITGPEHIQIELATGRQMGRMVKPKPNDPPLPPVGTKLPVRLCDYYAHELQRQKSPTFGVYWPEAERDKAVTACMEFVKNYKAEEDDAE
ncbi:MAG: hypothetical protein WEB58_07330, partial [Planctomycetaceae bacterium]